MDSDGSVYAQGKTWKNIRYCSTSNKGPMKSTLFSQSANSLVVNCHKGIVKKKVATGH